MEGSLPYQTQLAEALSLKADQIEKTHIRNLRSQLDGFEASVSAVYNKLIDKGFLQSDPYKNERTVTEITIPSTLEYSDAEESTELGLRLSNYVSQWEFIRHIFHAGLNNLSLRKVSRLLALIEYIRWYELSESSSYQLTRSVALLIDKITRRNDPITGKITRSSISHLRNLSLSLKTELKAITVFLRERYKYRVREELVTSLNIDANLYRRSPQDVLSNVKFEFTHRMPERGWYRELIRELLEEDYGENAEQLRKAVLDKLVVTKTPVQRTKPDGPDDKTVLTGILKRLARAGQSIRSSLIKMNDNTHSIQERKLSFAEHIKRLLASLFRKTDTSVIYEIRIKDPVSGAMKAETLNYTRFAETAMKRARTLIELQDTNSPSYQRASAADVEQLFVYIDKYLSELKDMHKRMTGLDAYFHSEAVPEELKPQMKGCAINLQSFKSVLSETIREMNKFRLRRNEAEQLRKLGIEE